MAKNYVLVGATINGQDKTEDFIKHGYAEVFYESDKMTFKPVCDAVKSGDAIAIKSVNGTLEKTITIKSIGTVKTVLPQQDRAVIIIDWKDNKEKVVEFKQSLDRIKIYPKNDPTYRVWLNKIFRINL